MRRLSIGLVCLMLGACASGPLTLDAPGEQQLTDADAVPVSLATADLKRIDRYVMALGNAYRYGVETGPIWQRAFASAAKDPVFAIKRAELRESIDGAGFTVRYTYSVTGELTQQGRTYPIRASGTRAAAMMKASAMRQAVELGVADAARQVKQIIRQ